ncbi:hypothetical protein [Nocardia bovistercoris]|uniref:Uncharacterized protein n=1 Tax=Nocardia bovistercoris TaxID=2785916 RepID=A0A931IIX0_9NOCA|nr:hypothetical protein [Nocardia bovistercoris]MBH0780520.1 hypothetical protein [Nocardia bovistercoris]
MNRNAIGLIHLGMTDQMLAAQTTIKGLAKRYRYQLVRILTIDADTYMPTTLIIGTAAQARAAAIITPDPNHLGVTYKTISRACPILLPTGLMPATTAYTTGTR